LYVLDRSDGHLISAEKLGKVTWAKRVDLRTGRPVEYPGIRYEKKPILVWPGYNGLHNWPPMSFSAHERLLFMPTINMANYYNMGGVDPRTWTPTKNSWTTGLGEEFEKKIARGRFSSSLLAWNPITQKKVWTVRTPGLWAGGTMVTAGGLVFQGQLDGTLNAYNMLNGRKLWSFDAGVAVTGAPITFIVDGTQYITVLAGPFAGAVANQLDVDPWRNAYRDRRRVLTFAIGGNATLPAERAPGPAVPIVGGPPAGPDMARTGASLFSSNCTNCHGSGAVSGGNAPDLRASSVVLSADAFAHVVRYGALVAAGMPEFDEFSTADLEALRAYIRSRANARLPASESVNGP
jgi:quinohemoprotein ethanol dehydrogenase